MDAARKVSRLALPLCALLFSAAAAAHKEEFPKRDALLIEPDRLTLTVQYLVPASDEAEVLRRIFDRDRSGELNAAEQDALRHYLSVQASAFVQLRLDGKPVALREERMELGPIGGRRDALSAVLTLSAALPVAPPLHGRHQLRFSDRHKDRKVLVPLRITARGLRILSSLPPLPLLSEGHAAELELEATPAPSR